MHICSEIVFNKYGLPVIQAHVYTIAYFIRTTWRAHSIHIQVKTSNSASEIIYSFFPPFRLPTTRSKRFLNVCFRFTLYINNEKRVVHARQNDKYTIIQTSVLFAVTVIKCFFNRVCIGEDKTHTLPSKVSVFFRVRYGFTNFVRQTSTVSARVDRTNRRAGDVNSLGPAPAALMPSVRSANYKNSPII